MNQLDWNDPNLSVSPSSAIFDAGLLPAMSQREINEIPAGDIACESNGVEVTERFDARHIIPDDDNPFSILRPLTRWNRNSTVIHASCATIARRFAAAAAGVGCVASTHNGAQQLSCNLTFDRVSHTRDERGRDRQRARVTLSAVDLGGGNYRLNHLSGVAWL